MDEKVLLNATVCLLIKDNQVLLGLKTKKIGALCRNGYGGGIENNESIKEAAILNGKKIKGRAKYGPYQKELLGPVYIEEVFSFEEN